MNGRIVAAAPLARVVRVGDRADFLDALDDERPPRISGREALKVHRLDALIEAGPGNSVTVAADRA